MEQSSMTNHNDFPHEAKKTKCEVCGKEFWRITSTHLWHAHRMTTEEYKEKYPESVIEDPILSQWKSRNTISDNSNDRNRALEYYGQECMRCGETENLVVHHLDFQNIRSPSDNHSIENLMVLCKSCHARIHADFKKGKFVGIDNIEKGVHYILKGLSDEFGLDLTDENFTDTPKRVARAYYEMCCGINCQEDIDSIVSTSFPSDYDGIIVQRDIKCYSMCPHHLLPVEYNINIAYIPNKKMLGISKLTRIVELLAKAPKLQEQYTYDIINVFKKMECKGAMVQVSGYHLCMGARGVKMPNARTITSSLFGAFEKQEVRNEFQMMLNE
ncbi:MAG TPA: GTP cyclohydrolase I FolE [Paludibacteraceae bacterium]|nr:GTP cyclohydrolase I FolE [Paludibacteraceae bacterium]